MAHFNAILIGGPPHSGKSVLTYSLTQSLRAQGIDHYVLRACPDGEGDWSNEATPDTVLLVRQKGVFTGQFVQLVCDDLARRHLPLLVDVGGRPTPEQEAIFDHCTHAVLLAPDAAGLAHWRQLAERHGLGIIAELISDLAGEDAILDPGPPLLARLAGLERHTQAAGPVFTALTACVATHLHETPAALRQAHLQQAHTELTVDLAQLAVDLLGADISHRWEPATLPVVLDYLPAQTPMAVYGRGPNWLFAALAIHAAPAAMLQFDARLGWVAPMDFQLAPGFVAAALAWHTKQLGAEGWNWLQVGAPGHYLDYSELSTGTVAPLLSNSGVVLSGKVPHWVLTGLALAYRTQPWVAVYQPQLGGKAVIVCTQTAAHPVGSLLVLSPGNPG